jgi:putative nucleotidyltransferase with HDIG domain
MEEVSMEQLRTWFESYTAGFYGGDSYVNAHIRLKHDHSLRTETEILDLAEDLGLDHSQKTVAQAVGLLHDVGRFEQFSTFRTFSDHASTDHGSLGAQILQQTGVLAALDPHVQHLICVAVLHHNKRRLPGHLGDPDLMYCRLVRDADKLDILQTLIHICRTLRADFDGLDLDLGLLPDEPHCTPAILEAALRGEAVSFSELRTFNDALLVQLAWVYDINYVPTFGRIRDRRLLEQILGLLPDLPEIRQIGVQVTAYVDGRLAETPVASG